MTERGGGVLSLASTGLRGLRSRLLLTLGSVLLAAISIGAAVVGPMYQTAASSSYLVTNLRSTPPPMTGMVFDYTPKFDESRDGALQSAGRLADASLNQEFERATTALWTIRVAALGGFIRLASAPNQCAHLAIEGRCPRGPDEGLILRADSQFAHVKIGQRIKVAGQLKVTVVGIYSAHPFDEDYWYDPADLESVPPQPTGAQGLTPYFPAPLLVTPGTFDDLSHDVWFVRATRRLHITPQTTGDDVRTAIRGVAAVQVADRARAGAPPLPGTIAPELGNELVFIGRELRERQDTARSTVAPAVISVILVALVLLLRLLSAAMDLRRSELALASLRGYSRRQMWLLGMIEPVLMVVISLPLGFIGGVVGARLLTDAWLVDGLPMPIRLAAILAAAGVVVTTLVVAALVVRDALGEPLSAQIAGVRRPTRASRWSLLLQIVLVAAAVAVLVATLSHTQKSQPDATDLALPILLAVATGLLTTLLAQMVARWWSAWTARRRGMFAYLASRTISRRREGTLVILPLTAALAVAIFAAGVFTAAADWRASDAATLVGAARSYSTKLTMDQAVGLTHRIDPDGRWLMAVGAQYSPDGERLIMDTPRLPRVGVWPDSWTPGMSAADVSRALAPKRPSVVLRGRSVSVRLDNQVTGTYDAITADITMLRPDGSKADVILGPYPRGVSTFAKRLPGCLTGCLVTQLSFGGPAGLPGAMRGAATLTAFTVDGKPVPSALDLPWRTAQRVLDTPSAVAGEPRLVGESLRVDFASTSADSFAAISPDDVPRVRPVIMGRTAELTIDRRLPDGALELHTDSSVPLDVSSVEEAESMPVLGPTGMLIDYTMLTRDVTITNAATVVTILARADTPNSVVAALGAQGITDVTTLTQTRGLLDQDAFALALKLYLVVTAIVILLALAGLGANLAVQMPARRRDAASLRVVGVRRRSIISAVVMEFLTVLGAAAVAGIAAGSLAQYVVVRTVTLGYADTRHTPRLLASLNVGSITTLLIAMAVVLFAVAVSVAGLTVRGAKTASLRENAR